MVVNYRDSFKFYYLLGLSCLYSGDLSGATTYLRRAEQLKAGDIDVELAMAALQLRRRDVKGAIETYLDVIENHVTDKRAKRALDFLRKNTEESRIAELVDTGLIVKFYPKLAKEIPWTTILALAGSIAVLF